MRRSGIGRGLWLGELTHFLGMSVKMRFTMELASPAGGKLHRPGKFAYHRSRRVHGVAYRCASGMQTEFLWTS